MRHTAVIGAGQAGSALVVKLRELGFDGRISLIGEEPVPPYQRPPLSKKYMLGEMALKRRYLRPATFYAEKGIDLITDARVTMIESGQSPAPSTVANPASTPKSLLPINSKPA